MNRGTPLTNHAALLWATPCRLGLCFRSFLGLLASLFLESFGLFICLLASLSFLVKWVAFDLLLRAVEARICLLAACINTYNILVLAGPAGILLTFPGHYCGLRKLLTMHQVDLHSLALSGRSIISRRCYLSMLQAWQQTCFYYRETLATQVHPHHLWLRLRGPGQPSLCVQEWVTVLKHLEVYYATYLHHPPH